ncbi:MAG: hypothetical protein AABZ06_09530, partial [Bdellovibrionota bacterium]
AGAEFSLAEIEAVRAFEEVQPGSSFALTQASYVGQMVSTSGARAAIQLLWDVSDVDLYQFNGMEIQLTMAGGASGSSCTQAMSSGGGAVAGLFAGWGWIGGSFASSTSNLDFAVFHENPSNAIWQRWDGQRYRAYIAVNVESNFAASDLCASMVAVAGARLSLRNFEAQSVELKLYPIDTNVPQGGDVFFSAFGGVPPYRFEVSGSDCLSTGRMDGNHYYAPGSVSAACNENILVRDSRGVAVETGISVTVSGANPTPSPTSSSSPSPTPSPTSSSSPSPSPSPTGGYATKIRLSLIGGGGVLNCFNIKVESVNNLDTLSNLLNNTTVTVSVTGSSGLLYMFPDCAGTSSSYQMLTSSSETSMNNTISFKVLDGSPSGSETINTSGGDGSLIMGSLPIIWPSSP